MNNLEDLEKKINSELTTKINSTEIKHNQLYIEIDKEDIIDVTLFLKTNQEIVHIYLIKEPLFLIFFCNCNIPYNKASAEGGHPGT